MKKLSNTALIASGLRGFACAGLATAITAFFSWSFISSTASLDWMGSDSVYSTDLST
jgi:hypothetical protein